MKFGPDRRIRKSAEFQAIQSRAQRLVSPHFVFLVAPAQSAEALPRLGITVTKRVGHAARRSRLKRIIRAAFREQDGLLPRGYDLVVICRKDDPQLKSSDVVAQFKNSSKRLLAGLASKASSLAPES